MIGSIVRLPLCQQWQGAVEEVHNAVNEVRGSAGLSSLNPGLSKKFMRNGIRLERLHEFAREGYFYFDFKRWRTTHKNDPSIWT